MANTLKMQDVLDVLNKHGFVKHRKVVFGDVTVLYTEDDHYIKVQLFNGTDSRSFSNLDLNFKKLDLASIKKMLNNPIVKEFGLRLGTELKIVGYTRESFESLCGRAPKTIRDYATDPVFNRLFKSCFEIFIVKKTGEVSVRL